MTDPVRVDAPTLQDRPNLLYFAFLVERLTTNRHLDHNEQRWCRWLVDASRDAAERLDTVEAQLTQALDSEQAGWRNSARLKGEYEAERGQVTKAVDIVRSFVAASVSGTPGRFTAEQILEAFAAAGLPVGGETETTDGEEEA